MTRRRRTRILIDGRAHLRERLATEISSRYTLVEIDPPARALAMITMRETARKNLFYPGELLITEAKFQVAGHVGLGIITGDNLVAARELAIIDGAYKANLPETKTWERLLQEEERHLEDNLKAHEAGVLETKVCFETMDAD